ncbi:hypothetical protein AB205_0199990 [Aquarana catesbeiana]|uniref:Frog antimicrobial peptide brevinin-2/esculentin type domain-containing protein n=1 Tax=Aquarana catesbeiana TaxID=8400 RepID=A0A2G9QJY4_AQUCT|nr:hypothetical protein AB205_0199990 [Aquarana catesbeiana]
MITVSSPRRDADEDEAEVVEEVKRGLWETIKTTGKSIALNLLDKIKCKIAGGCPP